MSGARFVRFYPSDWRSGCIGLTPEEEGTYIRVCAHFWETGVRVPLDDAQAASRLMMDVRMYRRLKTKLIAKGKLHVAKDGIYSPRAERELAAANRAADKDATENRVEAARGSPDGQHAHGRNSVEGWETGADTVIDVCHDIEVKSPTLLGEVGEIKVEKESNINAPLKSLIQSHSKEKKEKTPLPPKGGPSPSDAMRAFEAYNQTALRCGLQQAAKLTPDRQRKIIARLKDYGLEGWAAALANIERSAFLTGRNDKGWSANLDFMLQASSFSKLHDGAYGNGRHEAPAAVKKASVLDFL